ncbi:hypothetical protein LSH36_63g07035 [Paralvinella palmiformis]|uniref:Laminin EGF-like domain-containing protein n=1 Tax=Paralvinella palmiformis TaxID=53620 RepID=A0AAD9NBS0_9ANNE|nr:hypothetical protein LSH36_63g07035 [Paralvinella palmiformis]
MDCRACNCDTGGSLRPHCEQSYGHCACRPHITQPRCDTPEVGYYVPYPDWITLQPEKGDCAILGDTLSRDGNVYVTCKGRMDVTFKELDWIRQAEVTW